MGLILVEGPNFHFNSDWLYFWRKVFHLHLINIDIIISPSRWRLGSRRRWWYPHFSWQEVSFGKTANCRIKIRCAFFLKGPAQKLFSSPPSPPPLLTSCRTCYWPISVIHQWKWGYSENWCDTQDVPCNIFWSQVTWKCFLQTSSRISNIKNICHFLPCFRNKGQEKCADYGNNK